MKRYLVAVCCFLLCFQVYPSLRVCAVERPFVDIRANDKDAAVVSSDTPVSVTVSVYPGEEVDQDADWWIAADAVFSPLRDWFSYVYPDGWERGIKPSARTPLFKLVDYQVFDGTLPVGDYTFYFSLEKPDGTLEWPYLGSDFVQVSVQEGPTAGFDPFINGPVTVDTLYPVNIQNMSDTDLVLLTTLQGIVAKESSTQIYLYKTQVNDYYPPDEENTDELRTSSLLIKNYLTEVKDPPLSIVSNPKTQVEDIVKDFENYISGYIVYDDFDITLNMSVTLCGIKKAIPLPKNDITIAEELGLNEIGDVLSISSYDDFITKYDSELNKTFIVNLTPTLAGGPRDYATMLNGMIFYEAPYYFGFTPILNGDYSLPIYGWGVKPSYWPEHDYVYHASLTGNFVVASDQSVNLSLLSSSNSKPLPVPKNTDPSIVYDKTKAYMTFIMSDGDNLQLMTNNMNSKVWYGSPYRGKFPVGWTMSPAMYYLEPDVWNFYILNATENDEFLLGPSTIGYTLGEIDKNSWKFAYQLDAMTDVIVSTGIKSALIFGNDVQRDDWSNYTYLGNIIDKLDGIFYHPSSNENIPPIFGKFIYDKPASQFLITINPTLKNYSDLEKTLQFLASQLLTDTYDLNHHFYAVYGVRNLSGTDFDNNNLMGLFNAFYEALDKSKIMVVKPSQFLDLMKQAQEEGPLWPNEP